MNYLYGLFKSPLRSNNNPFLVVRIVKQALEPLMPRIKEEMPTVFEKLNLLEIDTIDKITTNIKKFFSFDRSH